VKFFIRNKIERLSINPHQHSEITRTKKEHTKNAEFGRNDRKFSQTTVVRKPQNRGYATLVHFKGWE
jgi:hypothetical protein